MFEVFGEVDDGHPAPTKFAIDAVAVLESNPESIANVGHLARYPRVSVTS